MNLFATEPFSLHSSTDMQDDKKFSEEATIDPPTHVVNCPEASLHFGNITFGFTPFGAIFSNSV